MGSSSEQYCLRWNDFQSNVTGAFSEIRDDEDFLDCTLVADGQAIKAHKLVLSSCSPLFRAMLKKNSHPQPMVFLHGVRFVDVAAILNFMYHGEVNVNQEDLPTFLAAAEELRVRGLSDKSPEAAAKAQAASIKNKVPGPAAATSATPVEAVNREKESSSMQQQSHRRPPSDYPEDDSPSSAKRMRQSESEVASPDIHHQSARAEEDEEDGYQDAGEDGEDGGEGYYNHVDEYAATGTRGMMNEEGSPSQGDEHWYQHPSEYYQQQQQAAAAAATPLTKRQQRQLMAMEQSGAGRQVCPHCNKELKNIHSLTVHISRYHRESSGSSIEVRCPVCQRMYSNKYSLRTHMHLNHKEQLHLIGSGKKKSKAQSTGDKMAKAEAATTAAAVTDEQFYVQ